MRKYIHNTGEIIVKALSISQKVEVYGHDDLGRLDGYYELGNESPWSKIKKGIRNGSGRRR